MKIVQADEMPFERALEHRGGTFHYCRMLEGEPGSLGNFQLSYGKIGGDFFSPRHRHNFEQIRYQVEGTLDFARDGKLDAGTVGYFPEGVAYGPQTQSQGADVATIVLQFGGASGSGYLANAEMRAGIAALKSEGEFKDGVFRRRADVAGKRNVDGYQAIWEQANRRPMLYPKARYSRPFMMNPAHYDWVPVEQSAGVREKQLGIFTERRSSVAFLEFAPGASHYCFGRAIYLVLKGTGHAKGNALRRLSIVQLEWGERLTIDAASGLEVLRFGLPNLAALERERAGTPAMAAE
ncbi:MAG: hypothetical protein ACREFD_07125 [Stellaceae bacterium]